jgi:dihydrofolate reductase
VPATRYYVAASADGFIADRDDGLEWLLSFGFEEFQAHYDAFFADVGALVMGAGTYDFMLDQEWPYVELPVWVVTHRERPGREGADVRFVQGPVTDLHPRIVESARGRDVWLVGGGNLAAQFADAGLLDQLLVTYMPVVLGAGRPVLPVSDHLDLRLEGTTPFPSGAVEFAYSVVRRTQEGSATSTTTRVGSDSE